MPQAAVPQTVQLESSLYASLLLDRSETCTVTFPCRSTKEELRPSRKDIKCRASNLYEGERPICTAIAIKTDIGSAVGGLLWHGYLEAILMVLKCFVMPKQPKSSLRRKTSLKLRGFIALANTQALPYPIQIALKDCEISSYPSKSSPNRHRIAYYKSRPSSHLSIYLIAFSHQRWATRKK